MSLLFPIFAVTFDTNDPISLSYEGGYQFPLILIARLTFISAKKIYCLI